MRAKMKVFLLVFFSIFALSAATCPQNWVANYNLVEATVVDPYDEVLTTDARSYITYCYGNGCSVAQQYLCGGSWYTLGTLSVWLYQAELNPQTTEILYRLIKESPLSFERVVERLWSENKISKKFEFSTFKSILSHKPEINNEDFENIFQAMTAALPEVTAEILNEYNFREHRYPENLKPEPMAFTCGTGSSYNVTSIDAEHIDSSWGGDGTVSTYPSTVRIYCGWGGCGDWYDWYVDGEWCKYAG